MTITDNFEDRKFTPRDVSGYTVYRESDVAELLAYTRGLEAQIAILKAPAKCPLCGTTEFPHLCGGSKGHGNLGDPA